MSTLTIKFMANVNANLTPLDNSAINRDSLLADDFLANWQGRLSSLIDNSTILDLSFPGTHDTLTYDLSLTPSQGAWDDHDDISLLLHAIFEVLGKVPAINSIASWIRVQAQTQTLDVLAQLDAGIRFFDFRNMWTSLDLIKFDWYGLHFLQTNTLALTYLRSIRSWVDSHPTEVIVLWLSKHGSTSNVGSDQYPNVTIAVKQQYWSDVLSVFNGVAIDVSTHPVNVTTMSQLREAGQRVLLIVSDYQEVTSGSKYALDANLHLDNWLSPDSSNKSIAIKETIALFDNEVQPRMKQNKEQQRLTLMGLAGATTSAQGIDAFLLTFLPLTPSLDKHACASSFGIPSMTTYCPLSLIECGYLTNYYSQLVFEHAVSTAVMPNAIYLDALQQGGTIQIDPKNNTYAYVDSLLYINVARICSSLPSSDSDCATALSSLEARRAKFPLTLYDDDQGHRSDWPPTKL